MLKHKCARASQRKALWEREYPPDQNRPAWGWRLSSSWGKPGGRWVNFDELPKPKDAEEQRVDPWYSELQSSQEIFRRKMAEIRKRVDEDPFKAIFGRKLDRACTDWSDLVWGLAKKTEREVGVGQGSPRESQPQPKPTEKAEDSSKSSRHTVGGNQDQVNQHHAGVLKLDTMRVKAVTPLEPTTKPKDTKTGNNSSLSSLSTTEDFMIDPITLRKVPRSTGDSTRSDGQATNIPVKKFAGYRAQPSDNNNAVEIDNRQDALEIELSMYKTPSVNAETISTHELEADPVAKGLEDYELRISNEFESSENHRSAGTVPTDSFKPQSPQTETKLPVRDFASSVETTSRSRSQPPQIESSLSRRLRNRPKVQAKEKQKLRYNENESTVEDIDLLRASDVRAASGLAGRPRKETDEEKQRRRKRLEDDFNKPQGLETQFAEEIAAQTPANVKEIRSQESPVPETDAFGYDLTLQGLETSYERELQNRVQSLESSYAAQVEREEAALRDAEVDGFDRRPQGLEMSFAREQVSQKSEGLRLGEVAWHEASLGTADIDAVGKPLRGLDTPSPLEHATPSSQTLESQDGELHSMRSNDLDNTSQTPQSLPAGKIHQPPGEGDISANVHDFGVRDRLYKKQAPQATKEYATIILDELTLEEVLRRTSDDHQASHSRLQQESTKIPSEENSHGVSVERGLEAYDSKLGKEAYHFHTGQDSLEADILAQSEQQIPKRVENEKVAPYSSYSSPEALAMRWEEEEQKLHEELRETNDILSEAKAELSKIMANKEKSEPVDVGGRKASEPMESPERLARPSTFPDAKASEMDEKAALLKDGKSVSYRILAHDIASNEVVSVTASSSILSATETAISLPKAISRLANPAKFLPHFGDLNAAGFEVVSGGRDVLIFRKVLGSSVPDPIVHPVTEPGFSDRRRPMNPIDGTTTQTGNFASPTGFVNYDVVYVPPSFEQAPPYPRPASGRTGGRVRREEDVFSGSSRRWQDEDARQERPRGKVRRLGKRVLLVGAWTAGCCYAVGVVAEFFRTGGANGMGAQGF